MSEHDDEYRGVGCTTETASWLNAFHEGDCDSAHSARVARRA